jgi:hypothetical protein
MYKNVHDYYKSCDACQKTRRLAIQSLAKLMTSLPKEPFMKWGLNFYGANQASRKIYNKQIYYYSHKLCYQVGGNKSIDN